MGQVNDLRAALTATLAVIAAVRAMDDPAEEDRLLADLERQLVALRPEVDPAIRASA